MFYQRRFMAPPSKFDIRCSMFGVRYSVFDISSRTQYADSQYHLKPWLSHDSQGFKFLFFPYYMPDQRYFNPLKFISQKGLIEAGADCPVCKSQSALPMTRSGLSFAFARAALMAVRSFLK